MFSEDEYLESGEAFEVVKVEADNCLFEGNLFYRKEGGFDLFLFRPNSEFECLEIDNITWLRHQAQGDDSLFIERFSEADSFRALKKRIEERFIGWQKANLGLPPGMNFKARWGAN